MEGGSKLMEYLTYGVVGFVLLALAVLAVRSAWFFASLLVIPLAESVGRWRPFRDAVARWGERGARRDPALWAARLELGPDATPRRPSGIPRLVRRSALVGATLGALPGVLTGIREAIRLLGRGGTPADAIWSVGMGVGLVGSAGALVGAALGAAVGIAAGALRARPGTESR
jgi:hypothetical protein